MFAFDDPYTVREGVLIVGNPVTKGDTIQINIGGFHLSPLADRPPDLGFDAGVIAFISGWFIRPGQIDRHQAIIAVKINPIHPERYA